MHDEAKQARIRDAQSWIRRAWQKHSCWFADGKDIVPQRVVPKLIEVTTREHQDLFRLGRFTWSLPYSSGYGRRLRFLVIDEYHRCLIGLLGLQSPPISFLPRDQWIDYESKERKEELVNQTMDIFTLGAIPPYNRLLGGKLMVYAASSKEIREAYSRKYAGATTEMKRKVIPAHLVLLTTTSAYGRSSIYNRVKYLHRRNPYARTIAEQMSYGCKKKVGYTKGFGSVHLDGLYSDVKAFLIEQGISPTGGYGSGPKPVWRNITKAMTLLGVSGKGLRHGIPREAWCIPLAKNVWEYLNGEDQEPDYYDETFGQLADWWLERWFLPRSERISDWRDWEREWVQQSITVPHDSTDGDIRC